MSKPKNAFAVRCHEIGDKKKTSIGMRKVISEKKIRFLL